jgi:hypothetical protein
LEQVVEHAKKLLLLPSLKVKIHLKVIGPIEYVDDTIKANLQMIKHIASSIQQSQGQERLLSYFAEDTTDQTYGAALQDGACRKDGQGILIAEYFSDEKSALKTGVQYALELGHTVGMRHDYHPAHGGRGGPCYGRGIMSYGRPPWTAPQDRTHAWTHCSNADFARWFNKQGFRCAVPKW